MLSQEELKKFEEIARSNPPVSPEDMKAEIEADQDLLDLLNEGLEDLDEKSLETALDQALEAKRLSNTLSKNK